MGSKNAEGKFVIILIISLIAFGFGSGIGITVGMTGDDLNATDVQEPVNATIDVTNNISQDNPNYNMKVDAYSDENDSENSNNSESVKYYSEEDLAKKNNNSNL